MNDIWEEINSGLKVVKSEADDKYADYKRGEEIKAWIIGGSIVGVLALAFYAVYRFSE